MDTLDDTVDTADIIHAIDTFDDVKSVNSVDNVSSVNSVHSVYNVHNDAAAREAGRGLILGIVVPEKSNIWKIMQQHSQFSRPWKVRKSENRATN